MSHLFDAFCISSVAYLTAECLAVFFITLSYFHSFIQTFDNCKFFHKVFFYFGFIPFSSHLFSVTTFSIQTVLTYITYKSRDPLSFIQYPSFDPLALFYPECCM